MKSPTVLLSALLTDVSRAEPGTKGLDRDRETIEKRFKHEGYGFLSIALPKLGDAILDGLSTGRFACPTDFSRSYGSALPRFLSGLLCKVFDTKTGHLNSECDPMIVGYLYKITWLFKKVRLPSKSSDKLDKKAKESFFKNDEYVREFRMNPEFLQSLRSVSRLVCGNLGNFVPDELNYRHGPGAVFEKVKGNQKWSLLMKLATTPCFYSDKIGLTEFLYSSGSLINYPEPTQGDLFSDPPFEDRYPSSSSARLITVPKNSTSRRTITVEPLLRQYVQQGLNSFLRDSISKCKILSRSLALTDQSANQKLALDGSLTGKWATIDLKSASDLLSLELVKAVFGHHVSFTEMLIDCRSPSVLDGETPTKVEKFAGMGNATTFPVQSIVFATIAITEILRNLGLTPNYRNAMRAASKVRVFGDDIIIDSNHASQVVSALQSVGLVVNTRKSFLEGNFRESCGIHAYKGVDITPVFVKDPTDDSNDEPNIIAGFVSLSNLCWFKGLWNLSDELRKLSESLLKKRLPLVPSNSGILGLHTHKEWSEPSRWNRSLHRFETRGFALVSTKKADRLSGYAALLKFFHHSVDSINGTLDYLYPVVKDKDHLSRSDIRYKNRIRQRWVPAH